MEYSPFAGLSPGDKVAVAYSGGVDSSIAAFLAKEYGCKVIALTLSLLGKEHFQEEKVTKGAAALEIPLEVLEYSALFEEKVIRRSWEEYKNGRTPNPCTLCNPLFKFGVLMEEAKKRSCKALLTGHYARILPAPNGNFELHKGVDPAKDQSYFLAGLTGEELSFSRFPLGGMTKEEVRAIAEKLQLSCAGDKESQDVCFALPGMEFGEQLRVHFKEAAQEGDFLSPAGKKLGKHKGIHLYTIGQRKGMGIALGCPAYVQKICKEDHSVIVTTNEKDLFSPGFFMEKLYFPNGDCRLEKESFSAAVKIRYRSRETLCTVEALAGGGFYCRFDTPQRAVTPGQLAVFYVGEKVTASGTIASSEIPEQDL